MSTPPDPDRDPELEQLLGGARDPQIAGDFDAMFGKLGDALVISVTAKGDIFSTQVCHQALKRSGFSTTGSLFVDNFKIEGKQLSGRFYTKKKEDFFDDSWEADLNVKATVP